MDIQHLLELSLSICYFIWDDQIYFIDNAGPICLSLMVVIAEGYLQNIENIALNNALRDHCAPKSFLRYVDDSHARFNNENEVDEFLTELNSQDSCIQYTVEKEVKGQLAFLDVNIINNQQGQYEFKVHRKDAITNVQLKPHSSINPTIINGVFKGFLVQACCTSSAKHLQDDIQFLIDVFAENGHERSSFEKMAEHHSNPDVSYRSQENVRSRSVIKIPWIPQLGRKLRKTYRKQGIKTVFMSAPSIADILCNHKSRLPPNSHPGVYKVLCLCRQAAYVGKTKKQVSTRIIEHEQDVFHGRWKKSGLKEHAKVCTESFDFENVQTLAIERNFRLRKIREALEFVCIKQLPTC